MLLYSVQISVLKVNNILIGANVKFNKDDKLIASVKEAISYNLNTFMFYTGAPQNTLRSSINDFKTIEAYELMRENGIDPKNVVVHAPYIINLANPNNFDFSVDFLKQELDRVDQLGISYMVLHPGSHVGLGEENGITNIIKGLNAVLDNYNGNVMILLETMAGKGSELGINFEQLKKIIDGVNYSNRIGVCLDTCHLNDAGYDISNFDSLLDQFDKQIGLDKIKCVHVNDSKNDQGTHKDRHENIGFGTIGFDNLINVLYNEKLENVPKILETPYINGEYPPYKFEAEMIRNIVMNSNLVEDIIEYSK